ncbi:MAG TPA: tetratricopeptide repeat-containing diguanylate cyclase [Thermoanaerobaculia bacterium]|jgi:diguanylate cyclase (GGDEF)-like protein
MLSGRCVVYALVCVALAARVEAADARRMLDEAERIRPADKIRSRALLDAVERDSAALADPGIAARVQLLECTWSDSPPPAHRAYELGIAAARRAGDLALQAKLTACQATALLIEQRQPEAEQTFAAAAALANKAGDATTESDALGNLGYMQYNRGAMADALTSLQTAYRICTRIGDGKRRREILSVIANVYADSHVAQYDRAIEYYRQLIPEYEQAGQHSDVADMLFNIGSTYEVSGNARQAETYYRRALAAFEKLGKKDDIAFTQRALGSALMKLQRPREALPLLDGAVHHYDANHDVEALAGARQYRGIAYRRIGRYDDALRELALARQFYERQNNVRFLDKNLEETALAYAQRGDWRNAYETQKRQAEMQQKLAASRRDELSSRLRVEFDAEKKDQENRALARENALRATALQTAQRNQKLQTVVIALTAMLAVALTILFWRQVANTRRMRAMAMTDELTRLPNRRHIVAAVDLALDAARRERRSAAVVIFDIDRFKAINDTYGHAAGDEVLRKVARTCRLELRANDQVGRIGGEEFLVLLDSATPEQAHEIAERLRAAVERIDFSSIAPGLRATISLGVSVANLYDSSAAIAAADSLLYRAKESGRNRVEMEVAL